MRVHSRNYLARSTRAMITASVLSGLIVMPAGDLGAAPSPCPDPYPASDLDAGQPLNGLTVERGTKPDPFTAEVLGVIENGIAPGVDMIVAEASSDGIDRAGGIWAGMSGSPVYAADGRLVGAVAYGLAFGASPIAGITPATEMYRLLDGHGSTRAATAVDLPTALAAAVVATGAVTAAEASAGLRQLAVPLGLSGLTSARADDLDRLGRQIPGTKIYAAGSASGKQVTAPLVAGGNVAAALSYGDVSAVGVGTVTAVCGDEALLFGHPFDFTGRTTLTAHRATALFVQPDSLGVPFKVANPGGVAGTVDEDRLAGLHTEIGTMPDVGTIVGTFRAQGGISRTSTTHVAQPTFFSSAAAFHTLFNLDRVRDQIGPGTVTLDWAASGRRANGEPWRVRVHDAFSDQFDATFFPAEKLFIALDRIFSNRFEKVSIDRVALEGTTSPALTQRTIVGLQKLGANGRWSDVNLRGRVDLVAGTDAYMRAVVRTYRSTRTNTVQFSVRVPNTPGLAGTLAVIGGGNFFVGGGGRVSDFESLLTAIGNQPSGDSVVVRLSLRKERQVVRRSFDSPAPTYTVGFKEARVRIIAPNG